MQALFGADKTPKILTRHSLLSYRVLREVSVDPVAVKRISGIDRLGNLTARSVVISPVLYRLSDHDRFPLGMPDELPGDMREILAADMRRLISTRQHLIIAFVPAKQVATLQGFFGRNTARGVGVAEGEQLLQRLSEEFLPQDLSIIKDGVVASEVSARYLGDMDEPHVVVGMSPSAWLRTWAEGRPEQRAFVTTTFAGAESSTISSGNYRVLRELGVELIPSSWLYRAVHSPKFWAYVVVFVYSTLRALPVILVPHFHGSVALLWTMDVVTAIPYTWGLVAFFTAHKAWVRAAGFSVTLITFIAPYIYFWTHGRGYSWEVNAVVVAMILGAILYETFNYLRDRAVATGLRSRQLQVPAGQGPRRLAVR